MKKIGYLLLLLIFPFLAQSQTITLTFEAIDSITQDSIALDSVNIYNISLGCDTTISGENSITIPVVVGIRDISPSNFKINQNFPNPFYDYTTVEISLPKREFINIVLSDNLGRNLATYSNYIDRGISLFRITTDHYGLTILSAYINKKVHSIKMINASNNKSYNSITCVGNKNSNLKFSPTSNEFVFCAGDSLQYTSFSNNYIPYMLIDNPTGDTTYIFPMSPGGFDSLEVITDSIVTNITQNTAESGGCVISDGGDSVTSRGVCWSTSQIPTIFNNHTIDGSDTGTFVSYLTGLTCGTLYYIRAYAINELDTAYGNEVYFTTEPGLPTVTTSNITNITTNSATSGGEVTSDGGENVTARGVCWSTSPNPTVSGNHTNNGTGTGTFVSNMTGLNINTFYYIRAYATNSVGTSYGNELGFTTLLAPCPGVPTVTYGGVVYNTVQIGSQCWMRENLNIGTKINGGNYQTDNSVIEKWCYDELESNCDIYGGIYQWNEIMQYTNTPGAQGICPTDWHIPTNFDYQTLESYVTTNSCDKLRETGTIHWLSEMGATNEFGFTLLGAGVYANNFNQIKEISILWTSNEVDTNNSNAYYFNYQNDIAIPGIYLKANGYSVRCIKN
jgi:uncharacterized protein (TIGR02145 family)